MRSLLIVIPAGLRELSSLSKALLHTSGRGSSACYCGSFIHPNKPATTSTMW